jgi:adenylate cyclase
MAEERVQRRLAAIMAADVVGYSRLMGSDETGTLAALKELRAELIDPTIAEFQGRIVKLMGDGALVEFASVVDAVECAVRIQRGIVTRNADIPESKRIAFRIGINLGDVIIEGDDIYGDGVNVAARLEGLAEPGGVCISDLVHQSVAGKLELTFEDMGEQSVKNIAEPIRTYRIDVGIPGIRSDDASSTTTDAGFLQRPALAVLPFENLGGDPEQAYFADGLTEDIITALSLWRSFPVIARHSSFVYKGEAANVQEVGRELGARYVLEGSVRRAGERVRVSAQLIDADTGHHVWAEKFDRQFEDIFDLQDELTQKIAAIVAPELERVEDNRSKVNQPQNLDAWHLVQRGMALLDEYNKESNLRAREMFGQALKLDPTYSRANSGLALAYARALMSGYEYSREAVTEKCMEAARQAVALDSSDAYAHNMLGMACLWARQNKDAISSLQRAVELNPSYGHARASLGDTLNRIGRTEEGISLMEDALRLNPDAPNLRHINAFLARACIITRRYEDAVEWARKAIHLRSDLAHAHCLMAVALAHLGRSEDARAALDECRHVQPDFFDSAAELSPYEDPAANEHILEGLLKAGWKA